MQKIDLGALDNGYHPFETACVSHISSHSIRAIAIACRML
jgi:hypothetical protein